MSEISMEGSNSIHFERGLSFTFVKSVEEKIAALSINVVDIMQIFICQYVKSNKRGKKIWIWNKCR